MVKRITSSFFALCASVLCTVAQEPVEPLASNQSTGIGAIEVRSAQTKWPDCYCTDRNGTRIEMGQKICMTVDGRSFMAQCAMSQNTPAWREIDTDCASLPSS